MKKCAPDEWSSRRKSVIVLALAMGLTALLPVLPARANEAIAPAFDPAALQAAAQSGDPNSAFQLGTLEYVGIGVVQDYIGAATSLKLAAKAGDPEAQCELGFLYQTGSFAQGPPPPDPTDALPWYKKSAAQGNAYAELALGMMYLNGIVVTKDPVKAAALYAQATAQGLPPDPTTFPLQQLQRHYYDIVYKITGETHWVDLVSIKAGGGQN